MLRYHFLLPFFFFVVDFFIEAFLSLAEVTMRVIVAEIKDMEI